MYIYYIMLLNKKVDQAYIDFISTLSTVHWLLHPVEVLMKWVYRDSYASSKRVWPHSALKLTATPCGFSIQILSHHD